LCVRVHVHVHVLENVYDSVINNSVINEYDTLLFIASCCVLFLASRRALPLSHM
jgi:hypothetical protein